MEFLETFSLSSEKFHTYFCRETCVDSKGESSLTYVINYLSMPKVLQENQDSVENILRF